MTPWFFLFLVITGAAASLFLKSCLSGNRLNSKKLFCGVIFNGLFAIPYINIIERSEFLFLGIRLDIVLEHPSIPWIAFAGLLLHLFALPSKSSHGWWFPRKPTPIAIDNSDPEISWNEHRKKMFENWGNNSIKNLITYALWISFSLLFWLPTIRDWVARSG